MPSDTRTIHLCESFDDIASKHIRLLDEARRSGQTHVVVWPDRAIERITGKPPKFPLAERLYFLENCRYVSRLEVAPESITPDALPGQPQASDWFFEADSPHAAARLAWCSKHLITPRPVDASTLRTFPPPKPFPVSPPTQSKRVIVTGCYDWFHSGHVRFFEECSWLGDLYVVVGHDANIRLLKGEGHPMIGETERNFVVGSISFVKASTVSTGHGWLDAEPEIARLRPHIYAVNEDGDKPEKRSFCERNGIEYVVLRRAPRPGLTRRTSTALRGF